MNNVTFTEGFTYLQMNDIPMFYRVLDAQIMAFFLGFIATLVVALTHLCVRSWNSVYADDVTMLVRTYELGMLILFFSTMHGMSSRYLDLSLVIQLAVEFCLSVGFMAGVLCARPCCGAEVI